jgi:hypothetical protein
LAAWQVLSVASSQLPILTLSLSSLSSSLSFPPQKAASLPVPPPLPLPPPPPPPTLFFRSSFTHPSSSFPLSQDWILMQVHVGPSMGKLHLSSDLKFLSKVRPNPCSNSCNLAVSDSVQFCKSRQNSCAGPNRVIQSSTDRYRKDLQIGVGFILRNRFSSVNKVLKTCRFTVC